MKPEIQSAVCSNGEDDVSAMLDYASQLSFQTQVSALLLAWGPESPACTKRTNHVQDKRVR